ncbi:MAG: aspartate/glutamate racemase family protein [Rhodospirillales bacterium]|jgi:maleate isomerase|nr:aspartate/glutamate racemase family protein [Rhodospirillales bacterium]
MSDNPSGATTGNRPDSRARVALLVPSSNTVMENDLHAALPKDRVTVHTARMYLTVTTPEAEERMIDQEAPKAADDLGTVNPDVLVFGCTSGGSLHGLDYDAKVCGDLGRRAGCPAIGVISSVLAALGRRKLSTVAVITPYIDSLTEAVAGSVRESGIEVVAAHGMGIDVNVALADPTPDEIAEFAKQRLSGLTFDGLFVSCTNFRSVEAIGRLEKIFGCPVVTSTSATREALRGHLGLEAPTPKGG